jgi:hypothetical protein
VAALKREASDKDKENKLFMYSFVFPLGIINVSFLFYARLELSLNITRPHQSDLAIIINILTDSSSFSPSSSSSLTSSPTSSPQALSSTSLLLSTTHPNRRHHSSNHRTWRLENVLHQKHLSTRVAMLHVARKQNIRDVHMARPPL